MDFHFPPPAERRTVRAMKRTLAAALLLSISVLARADFVLENKLEAGRMTIPATLKMKGDRIRMDVATGPRGATSTIIDTATGEITQLLHARKIAVKMSGAALKEQSEAAKKRAGISADEPAAKPKATGAKERVGEWDCEIYIWSSGTVSARLWVATNVPKAAELKALTAKLNASGLGSLGSEMGEEDLPGVVVKTETKLPSGRTTLTVTAIREEEVAASELVVPSDYNTVTPPPPGSGKKSP